MHSHKMLCLKRYWPLNLENICLLQQVAVSAYWLSNEILWDYICSRRGCCHVLISKPMASVILQHPKQHLWFRKNFPDRNKWTWVANKPEGSVLYRIQQKFKCRVCFATARCLEIVSVQLCPVKKDFMLAFLIIFYLFCFEENLWLPLWNKFN